MLRTCLRLCLCTAPRPAACSSFTMDATVRRRPQRLSHVQAEAVRSAVVSTLSFGASEWCSEAVLAYGALLLKAWQAGPDGLEDLRSLPGPHPLVEALGERARRCFPSPPPHICLSMAADGDSLPPFVHTLVKKSWQAVLRHRQGTRSGPAAAAAPRVSLPARPSCYCRQRASASSAPAPALRRSIPIGGRLPAPDEPLSPSPATRALVAACLCSGMCPSPPPPRRPIRRLPLPVQLADPAAGRALLARLPLEPLSSRDRASRRVARVDSWRLPRLLDGPSDAAIFTYSRVASAVGVSPPATTATLRHALRGLVYRRTWPTPLASSSGFLWIIRRAGARPVGPRGLAVALGYGSYLPAIRAMAQAVTRAQATAIMGQSVHFGATKAVLCSGADLPGWPPMRQNLTFALMGSGAGLWALPIVEAVPSARYVAFAEAHPRARAAHDALWSSLGQAPTWFRWAHDHPALLAFPAVDILLVSLPCAPFSSCNRQYPAGVEAALLDLASAMRVACRSQSRAVIIEQTASLRLRSRDRARHAFEAILQAATPFSWRMVFVCPSLHLGQPISRPRVFYIGVRA